MNVARISAAPSYAKQKEELVMKTILFKSSLFVVMFLMLGSFFSGAPAWVKAAAKPMVAQAASLTVTNTSDSGPGSLRQALADAQPGDTITFASGLNGAPVGLTSGPLTIDKNLTVSGLGASQLAISAGGHSRVFVISGDVSVTLT